MLDIHEVYEQFTPNPDDIKLVFSINSVVTHVAYVDPGTASNFLAGPLKFAYCVNNNLVSMLALDPETAPEFLHNPVVIEVPHDHEVEVGWSCVDGVLSAPVVK